MINDLSGNGTATMAVASDTGNAIFEHSGVVTRLQFSSVDVSTDTDAFIKDLIQQRNDGIDKEQPEQPIEASAPAFRAYMHRDVAHGAIAILLQDGVYRFNLTARPSDITMAEARKALASNTSEGMKVYSLNSPFPIIAFGTSATRRYMSAKIPSTSFAYSNRILGISGLVLTLPQCAVYVQTDGKGVFQSGGIAAIVNDAPKAAGIILGYLPLSNMHTGGRVCTGTMIRREPNAGDGDSDTRSLAETLSIFWSTVMNSDWNLDLLSTAGLFPSNLTQVFDTLRGETLAYDALCSLRVNKTAGIPGDVIRRDTMGDVVDTNTAKAFKALYVLSRPQGHTLLDYTQIANRSFIGGEDTRDEV